MDFLVVLEENVRGVFIAKVPQLPCCHTQGENRHEAANIRDAIGLPLSATGNPEPRSVTVENVTVEA